MWPLFILAQTTGKAAYCKSLRDSTINFGIPIEPYLKSVSNGRIVPGFNYTPYINQFLEKNKYVKFPAQTLTIGLDPKDKTQPVHLVINSGNRLYFPAGAKLVCPADMLTNGYMVMIQGKKDVFIDGINITGSKVNSNYKTSEYGSGICIFYSSDVTIVNATIKYSSGDGFAVRTNWGGQCGNIYVDKMLIDKATRAGMLITSTINGTYNNITIRNTGETAKDKILYPQNGLSFEPDNCESEYKDIVFNNLQTVNNFGPVIGTANFANMNKNQNCPSKKISVTISNWKDETTDPKCYGATFDISTADTKLDLRNISGEFKLINPVFLRSVSKQPNDNYFILGKDETLQGGVTYTLINPQIRYLGKNYTTKNKNSNPLMNTLMSSSRKTIIK